MARQSGTLNLSSNFEPKMAAPLDSREVVDTLRDLTAVGSFPYAYVGMKVSVRSEKMVYLLIGADTTKMDNWKPFTGYTKEEVDEKLDEKADKEDTYTKDEVDGALDLKADKSDTYTKDETDNLLNDKADKEDTYTKQEVDDALDLKADKTDFDDYYTKTETDNLLSDKVDNDTLNNYYTKDESDNLLDDKADKSDTYTKTEVDTALSGKADASDLSDYYTKTEADDLLDDKADKTNTYTKSEIDNTLGDYYTKNETDILYDNKADKSTTYTKSEVDDALLLKANQSTTYTKTEVDTALNSKADTTDLDNFYTKSESNALLNDKADKSTTYDKEEVDSKLDNKVDKVTGKQLSSNDYTDAEKLKLSQIPSDAEANVQSDWEESDTNSDAFILNKPTSLPASDVYAWAKAATKPDYSASEITGLGTSAIKDTTDIYTASGTDPITGTGVASALATLSANIVGGSNKYIISVSEANGIISAVAGDIDTAVTEGSNNLITSGAVFTALNNLPEPMVFKGSLGVGGTITQLPVDGSAKRGDTYKVITDGTYAGQVAKVGDTFICLLRTASTNVWEYIPSGDEPSGTVTSIKIEGDGVIVVDDESAITDSGERTISHADSGVTAGTYLSVTVDAKGHVTGGTNPKFAGSATDGGSATSAEKLSNTSKIGDTNQPVYFTANGVPVAIGYTIDKSVPSDAKFTDTTYTFTNKDVTLAWGTKSTVAIVGGVDITITMPSNPNTNTKNTAGSTDTASKIYLIGATSQAANPQTYSQDTAYVGTDGCLYSGGTKVLTAHQTVTDNNPTLAWGTKSKVATIGGTEINVTMPSNPNTNTTYSMTRDGTSVKLTPSSGTAQSVTLDSLITNLPAWTATPTDDTYLIRRDTSGTAAYGQVKFSTVWTYINSKVSAEGYTKNAGTVTRVKVGTTAYNPSSGVVSLPAYPVNTDTKVTSSANHYTPSTASGSDKTASASGATAAWSIDVVKGVTLNTDGKGHVTGLSVTSGKIPANPNTDTKVKQSESTTSSWRKVLLHCTPDSASTTAVTTSTNEVYAAVGVSVQPSTGTLAATKFSGPLTGNVTGNCSGSSGSCTGNAATATKANLVSYLHTNEINFSGGAQSTCYFNYRNADTDTSATSAAITYKFCNYTSSTASTTIEAGTFKGSLSGNATNVTGTVAVAHGGTGATTAANARTNLGLGAAATRAVYTLSAVGDSGWSTEANRTKVPDMAFMAYWNGAYSGTSSNLAYCNKGAFGTIITKSTSDYAAASTINNTYWKFGTTNTNVINCTYTATSYIRAKQDLALESETTNIGMHCGAVYVQSYSNWNVYRPVYASDFSKQSSRTKKKNIEDMSELEAIKLLELRPVKYDYINEENGVNCYGLIAEEVQEIGIDYPISIMYDPETEEELPSLDYSSFVPYLIKVVQMQQKEIESLKQKLQK